ncbi:MAG: acetylglutamate kinase [Bacteroidales bacterium]
MRKLILVKVGGKVVENHDSLNTLLKHFSAIKEPKVLIHGGGRSATTVARQMGIETKMINGRRITDSEMLKVVTMVYGGLVNKNIVAKLQSIGINALGLTGADLNYMEAVKRPVKDIDYGYAGDITKVNIEVLCPLVEKNIVPVLAPLSHNKNGQLLNTNADTIAAEASIAFSKYFDTELIYCFDMPGVMSDPDDNNSVIANLTYKQFKNYQEEGVINDGMIPKLDNSFRALEKGVNKIRITNIEGLTCGGTNLINN